MGEHETVTEVRAEAALLVAVPLALGATSARGSRTSSARPRGACYWYNPLAECSVYFAPTIASSPPVTLPM